MTKTVIVIPARYASVRYPGKPLADLRGATGVAKSLINRTWDAAMQIEGVDRVVIATDDVRIEDAAKSFGAEVVMTSKSCANGTERCAEAISKIPEQYDVVVNLQGDAPLTPSWFIEELISALIEHPKAEMATPVLRCDGRSLSGFWDDRRAGRVGATTAVFGDDNRALYFSKELIPYCADVFGPSERTPVFHHVGVYAYRPKTLCEYASWDAGVLEKVEGLEQLRFLEKARYVQCVEVDARDRQFWEVNNPEDVKKIESMMLEMQIQ